VSFLDSAGLEAIHVVHQKLTAVGGSMSMVNPLPQVQKLMERANLTSIIPIHSLEEEALLVG
jgi:anti-anti-sigma factor